MYGRSGRFQEFDPEQVRCASTGQGLTWMDRIGRMASGQAKAYPTRTIPACVITRRHLAMTPARAPTGGNGILRLPNHMDKLIDT